MKLEKVLIPLDGSLLAEAALPKLVELVEGSGAKVLLLRAAEGHTFFSADPTEAQVKAVREAEDYLGQISDRLGALGIRDVQVSVWYGPAASAIVEAARFYKVDLITMTTHGRSGLGRLVMGSVAESVLRGTTTPILLIRVAEAPVEAPSGVAKPWPDIRHV
jgi:nucleotide-binding universal stress UspA family protein